MHPHLISQVQAAVQLLKWKVRAKQKCLAITRNISSSKNPSLFRMRWMFHSKEDVASEGVSYTWIEFPFILFLIRSRTLSVCFSLETQRERERERRMGRGRSDEKRLRWDETRVGHSFAPLPPFVLGSIALAKMKIPSETKSVWKSRDYLHFLKNF